MTRIEIRRRVLTVPEAARLATLYRRTIAEILRAACPHPGHLADRRYRTAGSLPDALKIPRRMLGLTQQELASRVGVDDSPPGGRDERSAPDAGRPRARTGPDAQ
jgi:hypothetical protein